MKPDLTLVPASSLLGINRVVIYFGGFFRVNLYFMLIRRILWMYFSF
jgi:hypothetical protein